MSDDPTREPTPPSNGDEPAHDSAPPFRVTLLRVMLVQVIAVVLLALLQLRYHG